MDRLEQLRARMEEKNLDGFYIAKQPNVRCISGFTGEDSSLFITRRGEVYDHRSPVYGAGVAGMPGLSGGGLAE